MTENWTESERDAYFAPGTDDTREDIPPYTDEQHDEYASQPEFTLFDAPDYALFVRHKRTERGKEYETKVASMLKAGALGAFKNGQINDGCAILHYGPTFAKKCGDLTDVSQGAARAIDMLATPDNPWVGMALITIPFALQMFRNHQAEATMIREHVKLTRQEKRRLKAEGITPLKQRRGRRVEIKLPFGKKLNVHVALPTPKIFVNAFYAQTKDPRSLTNQVLSDTRLLKALEKEGIQFVRKQTPNE